MGTEICVCGVHACLHVCTWRPTDAGSLSHWSRVSQLTPEHTSGKLAFLFWGSSAHLQSSGITSDCQIILTWALGFWALCSCWCGSCFNPWAISSAQKRRLFKWGIFHFIKSKGFFQIIFRNKVYTLHVCIIHIAYACYVCDTCAHTQSHKRISFISLILGFTWILQLDASYSDNQNETVKQKNAESIAFTHSFVLRTLNS